MGFEVVQSYEEITNSPESVGSQCSLVQILG